MKRTFTSILLLTLTMITTLKVSAQTPPVQSPDRDKISNVMMNMIGEWDHNCFLNAAGLVTQMTQFDMTEMTAEILERVVKTPKYNNRLLITTKALTGHFVVNNGKWVKASDANDLQLSYTSPEGVPCVLKMVMSGSVKVTNMLIEDDEYYDEDDDWDDWGDYEEEEENEFFAKINQGIEELNSAMSLIDQVLMPYIDETKMIGVEVPEKITIEVTFGGKPLMTMDVKVNLNSVGETLDDGLVTSIDTKFYKGGLTRGDEGYYQVSTNNTGYMPGTGFNMDISIKNNNQQLLGFKLNAPGTMMPMDLSDLFAGQPLDLGFESLYIDLDFMGQMQVKGGIEDLGTLLEAMAYIEEADEETLQQVLAQANEMINMYVYYDGSNTPAAKLQLLPEFNEFYEEWELQPAIVFTRDNSAYTLQEFLSEENFPEVARGMMNIVNEVFDVVDVVYNKTNDEVTRLFVKTKDNAKPTAYYTLDGRRTTATAQGMKIVTMSDGTIRKVVR